jgi:fatty-acyl-CoA synthase
MSFANNTQANALSIVKGIPLADEPGLGALTLSGYLREITTRFAAREAMVFYAPQGVMRWSYATFWEHAVEVARALLAAGVGKGSRVGVLMTNRPECLAAAFGTALAGGVATMISTFSTPVELEYLLQLSGVSVLLCERHVPGKDFATILTDLEPALRTAQPGQLTSLKFPFLRRVAMVSLAADSGGIESWPTFLAGGNAISPALVDATAATVKPSDPGVLFFSSGTTSKPKGILSAHRGVSIQLWRWRRLYCLDGDIRSWTANGFFWSGIFSMALGLTFSCGGSLVLQPTFVADAALELLQKEKVNLLLAWPHQWARLEEAPNWNKVNLSSLKYLDRDSPVARHPTVSTQFKDPRAYGCTETFAINTAYAIDAPPEVIGDSYGPPLPGNTLKIVDPLTGVVVPRGQRGEIAVKGPTLMLGYLGTPLDETVDEEGFYHCGDGGYVDAAGMLYWEGRLSDIIKTGGANVSPVEIDLALSTYPGIKITQTVGVPHDTLGELVVTCVVLHDNATLSEATIREFLKQQLASYKVPRRVLFFQESELSMTGSAKVKSSALRELAAKRLSV